MKAKAEPSFFPAQVDLAKFNWTQEKADKIGVRASATEYELTASRETPEGKELGELLDSFSIDCLLTPRERYWACRYAGLLGRRPKDHLHLPKYEKFAASGQHITKLRGIKISPTRTCNPVFEEKNGCYEMMRLQPYTSPAANLREGSRSEATIERIAAIYEEWIRGDTALKRFREFQDCLSPSSSPQSVFHTWTEDELATVLTVLMILDPSDDSVGLFARYLKAWEGILRSMDEIGLVFFEARSRENVLMMEKRNKCPFVYGFKNCLWNRVREAEVAACPIASYDPYHDKEDSTRPGLSWIQTSELFRPFYWGNKVQVNSAPSCRPGVIGETLINDKSLVQFELMLIHLRLLELRARILGPTTHPLRVYLSQTRNKDLLLELFCPRQSRPRLVSFRQWTGTLPPCLQAWYSRLEHEASRYSYHAKTPDRFTWELGEALKVATRLYRANEWTGQVASLADDWEFHRLGFGAKDEHREQKDDSESASSRLLCSYYIENGQCPYDPSSAHSSSTKRTKVDRIFASAACTTACKAQCQKRLEGVQRTLDIEDILGEKTRGFRPRLPIADTCGEHAGEWSPVSASKANRMGVDLARPSLLDSDSAT